MLRLILFSLLIFIYCIRLTQSQFHVTGASQRTQGCKMLRHNASSQGRC